MSPPGPWRALLPQSKAQDHLNPHIFCGTSCPADCRTMNLRPEGAHSSTILCPTYHMPVFPGTSVLRQAFNYSPEKEEKPISYSLILISHEPQILKCGPWFHIIWECVRNADSGHIPDLTSSTTLISPKWLVGTFKLVLWLSNKPDWGLGETSCLDSPSNALWDDEPLWALDSSVHKVEVALWFSSKVWDTLELAERCWGLLQK